MEPAHGLIEVWAVKLRIGYVSRNQPMREIARLKWMQRAIACALTATTLACASSPASSGNSGATQVAPPLAAMAARPVLVLPVQYVAFSDSLGWRRQGLVADRILATLDDSIAVALGDRGLASWTFAPAITASARRNAGMTADPHALAAEGLRRLVKAGDDPLSEPLASQIRSLVALREGRYAILPVILRLENLGAGARASLLLYLIDSRTARIAWSGEIAGTATRSLTPAIAGEIAERFADMVLAR
jgi:hypothetical protein